MSAATVLSAMPADIMCHICKSLPILDQYEMAANIFGSDCDYIEDFVRRQEYLDTMVSKVYDDVTGVNLIEKYGRTLISPNPVWKIICKTPVYGLPEGYQLEGIHKIPMWQELVRQGLAGSYFVSVSNTVTTELEVFEITLTVANIEGSTTEFMATIEVDGWENNEWEGLIVRGIKDVRFTGAVPDLWLQGEPLRSGFTFDEEWIQYTDGTIVNYVNQPGCTYTDYRIGVSAGVLTGLLF